MLATTDRDRVGVNEYVLKMSEKMVFWEVFLVFWGVEGFFLVCFKRKIFYLQENI